MLHWTCISRKLGQTSPRVWSIASTTHITNPYKFLWKLRIFKKKCYGTPTFSNRVCCLWIFLTATIMVWPLRGDLHQIHTCQDFYNTLQLHQTVGPSLHVEIGRNATHLTTVFDATGQRRRRQGEKVCQQVTFFTPSTKSGKVTCHTLLTAPDIEGIAFCHSIL